MHTATFLSADTPLTKSYTKVKGELVKTPYPHVRDFTSHEEQYETLADLHRHIVAHAALNHCFLKGNVQRPLVAESRAGSTDRAASTHILVFDLDSAPFKSPEAFLKHVGLPDVSYIVQYSASHGIVETDTLSCHIFILLTTAVPAQLLKQYLMHLNMAYAADGITLSRTGATLRWPIDISACQNDKLIYIAPALLFGGVKDTFKGKRIDYVKKEKPTLDTQRMVFPEPEALRKSSRELLNALRKAAGMSTLRSQTSFVGEHEVQAKPGEASITGIKEDRGFVYMNLNGGDSWGYYHPIENFELILNFKGEPAYKTKELLPGYYADCQAKRLALNATPSAEGDLLLAFRDLRTATYWNGIWNPDATALELHMAKNETQLEHFMLSHGRTLGEFVPIWNMVFDPRLDFIVDADSQTINTYIPSDHLTRKHKKVKQVPPTILRVLESAVGKGEILEHFLNWVALGCQQPHIKTGTAWLLHGSQGTGKGLFARILSEILGHSYVVNKRMSELQSQFNGWLEKALFVVVDEIQVSKLQHASVIGSDLRNLITEPRVSIRKMYSNAFESDNFTKFIFNSNMPDPVEIPPSDRRMNVGEYQSERFELTPEEFEQMMSEIPAFADYLMTRPASEEIARQVLKTETRAEMIRTGRNSNDMVADAVRDGDLAFLFDSISNVIDPMSNRGTWTAAYKALIEGFIIAFEPTVKLTRDDLLLIFENCCGDMPKTPNKFTSFLRHRRLHMKKLRKDAELTVGMDVTWKVDAAWLAERQAELTARAAKKPQIRMVR